MLDPFSIDPCLMLLAAEEMCIKLRYAYGVWMQKGDRYEGRSVGIYSYWYILLAPEYRGVYWCLSMSIDIYPEMSIAIHEHQSNDHEMAHLWMSADAHGWINEYLWLSTHISRLLTEVHLASMTGVTMMESMYEPIDKCGPWTWWPISGSTQSWSACNHHHHCQRFLIFLSVYCHAHYSHLRSFFYGMCSKQWIHFLWLFPLGFTYFSLCFTLNSSILKITSFCQQCATIKGTWWHALQLFMHVILQFVQINTGYNVQILRHKETPQSAMLECW